MNFSPTNQTAHSEQAPAPPKPWKIPHILVRVPPETDLKAQICVQVADPGRGRGEHWLGSGEGRGTGNKRKTKHGCDTKQVTDDAVDKRRSVPREPRDHGDHVAQSYALAGNGAAVFIHQVPRLSRELRASLGWGVDPGRAHSGCREGPQGEACRPRDWKRGMERAGDEGRWLGSYRRGPHPPR